MVELDTFCMMIDMHVYSQPFNYDGMEIYV